jgi:cellulose synthase/poly-beta-1,6-N-acetylglucosamine synthase-like glycosyltransferase
MPLLALGLAILALPVALLAAYLFSFVLLSAESPRPPRSSTRHRFRLIVPAHDEEQGIAETVRSLRQLDYPADAFSVLVIADNCSDATAERAREAGAEVLERQNAELRGKGYALLHAFERLPGDVDAVVVIDADTLVSHNLLQAFSARLALGADAIQADYAVRNPHQSWRTRLVAIAFGAFHIVRGRARERLQLSAGLRGNGMCFTTSILRRVAHEAFSIVEDVEYGIRLGEAGCRVHYADEAHVYGEMVSSSAAASSQRTRWEGGRKALQKAHGMRLVKRGLQARNRVLFDLGFDLLVPPLSRIAVASVAGFALAGVAFYGWGSSFAAALSLWGFCVASVVLYVLRGWSVSGTGLRGLRDLALAPAYVIWKATLGSRKDARPDAPWIRTTREARAQDAARH